MANGYPATCTRRCWDGLRMMRYYPGDRDNLDPQNPVSKWFKFDDPEIEAIKFGSKPKPPVRRVENDLTMAEVAPSRSRRVRRRTV